MAAAPAMPEESRLLRRTAHLWRPAAARADARFPREPALGIYLHAGAQAVYLAAGSATGGVDGRADLAARLEKPVKDVLVLGRTVSLVFGIAAVSLLIALGSRTLGAGAGLAAGVLLAFDPLAVSASQRASDDAILLAAVIAALLAMDALARAPSRRNAFAAGLLAGGAASVRYAGALLLVPLVALGARRGRSGAESVAIALPAAALAFLLGSPLVLLEPGESLLTMQMAAERLGSGGFGATAHVAALEYARRLLPRSLGLPALALALAGLVMLARVRPGRGLAPLAIFSGLYAVAIGVSRVAETRALLPLEPILFVAAATAAIALGRKLTGARGRAGAGPAAIAAALLVAIAAAPGLWQIAKRGSARAAGDTREIALRWIESSLPPQASFALERYGPPLEDGDRVVYWIPFQAVRAQAYNHAYHLAWYRAFDYIVVSEAMESRYASDPLTFGPQVRFYLDLARQGDLVKSFEPGPATGPAIAIYRLREKDDASSAIDSLLAQAPRTAEMAGFLTGLGAAYSHLGRLGAALAMQKEALEIAPGEPLISASLGATYVQAGQPDAALEVLKEGVRRFPASPELRYNLGYAYRAKRIDERALVEFQEAVRLRPNLADAHLHLGELYAGLGRYPEAVVALETYLALAPGSSRAEELRETIAYLKSHPAPIRPAGGA